MKKGKSFIFIQLLLGAAIACVGCGPKEQAAEPVAEVSADTVVKSDVVAVGENPAEEQTQAEEAKAFLENFYNRLDKDQLDYAFVKRNTTRKAVKYLTDNYDYDCDGGDCLATWMFLYEGGGDVGPLKKRTFEMLSPTSCKISHVYKGQDGKDYKYVVKLEIVKEGDIYKIDSIEPLFSGN